MLAAFPRLKEDSDCERWWIFFRHNDPPLTCVRTLPLPNACAGNLAFGSVKGIMVTYTAVGILEEWDTTMELFNAKVKSSVRDWRTEQVSNPGKGSDVRDHLLSWAMQSPEIHRAMATDMLLYDYALAVFKQQTSEVLGKVWEY